MKRLLVLAAMLAWSGMASAVVYKWMDAQGKIQYGDRPPDGVHAEIVEMLGNRAPRSAPSQSASSSGAQTKSAATASRQDESAKKAVEDDVSATRDKQCADAQAQYKKLIEGRRLFKEGADGERVYMSADEIDTARVNAKKEVDAVCDSPT